MTALILLLAITFLYAGYNLFVKVSSGHVPAMATTTILATICLQVTALALSTAFALWLLARGGHVLRLSVPAYAWAVAAGACIGVAEILYFYLFAGVGSGRAMAASIAIPTIVSGTIVITLAVSLLVFREVLSPVQATGALLTIAGIVLMTMGRAAA